MKLQGAPIDAWFTKTALKAKGGWSQTEGQRYLAQYKKVAAELEQHVHSEVTKGAIATDGGYLTDHGPEHIQMVIRRASALLDGTTCDPSPYEIYLLLMAIHLHDVGNAYGRKDHEKFSAKVLEWLGTAAGRDVVEHKHILRIARAHGGTLNGSKDTISGLSEEEHLLGRVVRPRVLAAILRLADELADERARASRFAIDAGTIPPGARIFHEYASALHSVQVIHTANTIRLRFDLSDDTARQTFLYNGAQVYLLDYIFERSFKMHLERAYCMRFLRRFFSLDTIDAGVDIHSKTSIDPVDTVAYRVAESGYPSGQTLHELCPELEQSSGWEGGRVTGAALAARLSPTSDNVQPTT